MPSSLSLSSAASPVRAPGAPTGDEGKLITSDGTTGELRKPVTNGSNARGPRTPSGRGHTLGT